MSFDFRGRFAPNETLKPFIDAVIHILWKKYLYKGEVIYR